MPPSANRHFDWLAPLYERLISTPQDSPLPSLARLPAPGWLLDAGGGTGRIAQTLQGRAEHILVLDESLAMLRQAKAKGGLNCVVARSEQLPFAQGTFSRAVMVDAFHHLADQEQSLRELWRTLRPGGVLVIEEPDIGTWPVKVIALLEKVARFRTRFRSPAQISHWLRGQGARIKVVKRGINAWIVAGKPGS